MKAFFMVVLVWLTVLACSPTKKIPPVNTVIDTKPKVVTPTVTTDNKVKPVFTPNTTIKMASLSGKWKFESSSEKDFSKTDPRYLPEISFNETDRKVSGNTGCNVFNGFFFTTGELFNFSPLAVNLKKCPDAWVEKYFTSFFKAVGFYKTEGNKVFLYHKNDHDRYLVFTKK